MSKEVKFEKVVSEKSFGMADAGSRYTFYVNKDAEKIEIARAIEKQYKVKVIRVRTITRPGKMKTDWKTRTKRREVDRKKVIVILKKGDVIKDFTKI